MRRNTFILCLLSMVFFWSVSANTLQAATPGSGLEPGLQAYWQNWVSHATKLGQINWYVYDRQSIENHVNWAKTTGAWYPGGQRDYFSLRLIGKIEITEDGSWLFALGSDDGARLWIDGNLVINDDSSHGYRTKSAAVTLTTGFHDIEIRYLERSYIAGLTLQWMGPSDSALSVVPDSAFFHDPNAGITVPSGGLKAYWNDWVNHAEHLGQVDWTVYNANTLVSSVYWRRTTGVFRSGGERDYFGLRLIADLDVPEDGDWRFNLGSEDGARLWIDGQLVVNDDASHSYRWKAGTVNLTQGSHRLEVRFLERSYIAGLVLTWKGPSDIYESVIPPDVLTPADADDTTPPPGHGLRAYWSNWVSHANTLGQVDWTIYDRTDVVNKVYWKRTTGAFYSGGQRDYFALRLVGTIDIPQSGAWRFNLGSEDGARLWIDGNMIVNDDASHSFRWRSGTVSLGAGSHTIEVRFLERSYIAGLVLTWKGPSDAYESVVPTSVLTPADVENPPASQGGLRAYWQWWTSHATKLGQIDWTVYDSSTIVESVNWRKTTGTFISGGQRDYFALRLVADLQIDEEGDWYFNLGSEDCARMWIDGQLIINDGSPHSYRWKNATVNLTAGTHRIEIRFLEMSYIAGLELTWKGPSDSYETVIPQESLTPAPLENSGGGGGTGLLALWSDWVSHALKLGQIDWSLYNTSTVVDNVYWRKTTGSFRSGGQRDYFALRLLSKINIPQSGSWTFGLGSEDGARMFIDGNLVTNDDASHSYRWKYVTTTLTAGEHDVEIRFMERSYIAGLVLTWRGPSDVHESVIPSSAFTPLNTSDLPDRGPGGLRAYWYPWTSHALRLGQIDWYRYHSTSEVGNVYWKKTTGTFHSGGQRDYFGLRLKGQVNITESGDWVFNMGSEDGARLFIDGQLRINDDASHSYRWRSASVNLTAGTHDIEIRFIERSYIAGLVLTYKGPSDLYEQVIPPSALTPADVETYGGPGEGHATAKWYKNVGSLSSLDSVNWDTPSLTTDVNNIYWLKTTGSFYTDGPRDYFATQINGVLQINEAGLWKFGLGSEDSARLYIDGTLVADDNSLHSYRWKYGSINLSPGNHTIRVEFYEKSYIAGLAVTWQAPSAAYEEVIPRSAFPDQPTIKVIKWEEKEPD